MDQLMVYPPFQSRSRHNNKFLNHIQQYHHSVCK